MALVDQLCVQMGFRRAEAPEKVAAAYLSGASPEVLDNYPELGLFRDIVFYFKLMMCSSADDLPPIRRWEARDAALRWTCEPVASGLPGFRSTAGVALKVDGFGRRLSAVKRRQEETGVIGRLMQSRPKPRAPPSGADLELVIEPGVVTEDDVLHVPNAKLPAFGGRLGYSDTELLCQFLTAPYLRIPLLIEFFQEESRLRALESHELQGVLDSCFFEPGGWVADEDKRLPKAVPSEDSGLTSSPFGLLMNELIFSPKLLLDGVLSILDKALEFDTGSYAGQSAPVILYFIRLVVRVEEYVNAVVEMLKMKANGGQCPVDACATALNILPATAEALENDLRAGRQKLADALRGRAFALLEQWRAKLSLGDNLSENCEVLAHMAFIFRNAEHEENGLDEWSVKTLITAQVFLSHNFAFDLEATKSDKAGVSKVNSEHLRRVERIEFIFSLVQKHRKRVVEWIEPTGNASSEYKNKVGAVLEDVISLLTGKGRLAKEPFCETPRHWASLSQPSCKGRLCPDTEAEGYDAAVKEASRAQSKFEDWLQTTTNAAVGTEINLQLGTFTLRSNQTELLDSRFTESIDFETVIGVPDARLQCARILRTEQCEQVKLMFRHDLQFWEVDPRRPQVGFGRPNMAIPTWISEGLKRVPKQLRSLAIMFEDVSVDRVRGQMVMGETLLEICVFKTYDGVHVNIFKVVSHGRRFFRALIFSSSAIHCLHDLPPSLVANDENKYEIYCGQHNVSDALKAADRFFGRGIVIQRCLSAEIGDQVFVPQRLLRGLLPSALLGNLYFFTKVIELMCAYLCLPDDFLFWQNKDDSLTGYKTKKAVERDTGASLVVLQVRLIPTGKADGSGFCNACGDACVERWLADCTGEGSCAVVRPKQDGGKCLRLLNLLHAPENSALARAAAIFSQIESIGFILAWTTSKEGEDLSVDLVELPRLRLSFAGKLDDGKLQFYSQEHAGLFISQEVCQYSDQLLAGLPCALLLTNAMKELYILVNAAVKPLRPNQCEYFPSAQLLERRDHVWLANLSVPHYLYQVHISRRFLLMPSLSAMLYILLLRFQARQYAEIFKIANSCVSDTDLTKEEKQVSLIESRWHICSHN